MGAFREAINNENKWTKTWNGEDALRTTSSKCLDFFGRAGAMRSTNKTDKLNTFDAAFKEDKDIAVKLLFYTRDIRGGYGERDTFNEIFAHLANINKESVVKNLWAVLEFGRAKDLYSLIGTLAEDEMWDFMHKQFELDLRNMELGKPVSLLAKWIATPDSSSEKTKKLGKLTASKLGYTYKTMREYKKKLRALRRYLDIPEIKMAQNNWGEIEYSNLPSKCMLKNRDAFKRHDEERYLEFIHKVNSGEVKMNMGTVVPCDIIQKVACGKYTPDLEAMWSSLPDMNNGNAMVICDTSGSMWGWGALRDTDVKPGTVAFALAIYFAERNKGDLKDLFMTFSDRPEFVELDGITLEQKFNKLYNANWDGSTNLEAAFDLLLTTCVRNKVPQNELPESLVIISDMQINCVSGLDSNNRMTFYDKMSRKYEQAGYKMPQVVFWNVQASNPTFHASADVAGVSMVSGYSPNIFKQVMENIGTTPYELMMAIVNDERYANITA